MAGPEWLTYDTFAGRVGEKFDLTMCEEPALQLELDEATEGAQPGGPGPHGEERMQFSVVFRGPQAPVLPQATYRLSHADLGELDLFLVPISSDAEGTRYEAAFA